MKKFLLTIAAALTATVSFAQTNLLTNGDFETWADGAATGWVTATDANGMTAGSNVVAAQSTTAHGGTYALALTNKTAGNSSTKNGRLATEEITLKAGTYTYTAYVKAAEGQAATRLGYTPVESHKVGSYSYGYNANGWNGPDTISTDWTQLKYEFTLAAQTTVSLVIMHSKNLVDATVLVDDASLTTTDGGIADGGEDPGTDPTEGAITVAEAQAAAAGTTVTVQGSVYAVGASSFVVGDKTGYIFHYGAADVKIGDVVTVTGAVSAYGGFNQFKAATVEKVSEGTVTYPTPTIMTGAEMDEWVAAADIDYVQITGKLNISGNYYNVNVDGASTAVGSIISPNDDLKAKLANGNTYVFTGFAMYLSGSKYINIALVDAQAEGETVILNDISNTLETAYSVEKCVELINDEKNDLSKKVYIKGKISQMPEGAISTSYGNANFWISDDGTETSQQFEIYRGYWFDGAKFTAEDQLKLGDEVIYYATMTKYEKTAEDGTKSYIYETNSGGVLVSLNGSTDAIKGIADEKNSVIFDLAGRRVSKAEKGIYIINGKKVLF